MAVAQNELYPGPKVVLKTPSSTRMVDLHPAIAALLKRFAGDRSGWFSIPHSEWKTAVIFQRYKAPFASSAETTWVSQSIHR
jgi:hypothetical protein